MCPHEILERINTAEVNPTETDSGDLPHFIKTEANFLRWPIFALHTKGLRNVDGIECRGRITRDNGSHEYSLRITRNTASLYPGPLSRKVHFALLSIAADHGFPIANPVTWTWRDLSRRMGVSYRGSTTIERIKAAIRSTHGIVIQTQYALFSRSSGQPLPARERGYHLYSDYAFRNEPLPDGGVADCNSVWFADWYLENLNGLYSAPIDYRLWQSLDNKSPIASRLYEFLLLNFYSGIAVLRINYPYLAQLLPVHAEAYPSEARRQLTPAFQLLTAEGMLTDVEWGQARDGSIQLAIQRGPRLTAINHRVSAPASEPEQFTVFTEVKEIHEPPPEHQLVVTFHRLWSGQDDARPSPREIELAAEMIRTHGQPKAKKLVELAVKRLKVQWPDAKSFGAIAKYLPDVLADCERKERGAQRIATAAHHEQQMQQETARRQQDRTHLQSAWDRLPDADREAIRQAVLDRQPRGLAKHPDLLHRLCLCELASRQQGQQ